MAMFARQQRRLLTAFGVAMTRHRALALAYSRSAIAISLPAGSAISAAYAFKQFRTGGASRRTAATVMVLSGLLSIAALALLYATGALATAAVKLGEAWHRHPALTQVSAMITLGLLIFVGLLAWQSSWQIHPSPPAPPQRPARPDRAALAARGRRAGAGRGRGRELARGARPALGPRARRRGRELAHRPAVPLRRGARVQPAAGRGHARRDLPDRADRPADPAHPGRHRRHRDQPARRARLGRRGRGRRGGDRAGLPAAVVLADHPGRAGLLAAAAQAARTRSNRQATTLSRTCPTLSRSSPAVSPPPRWENSACWNTPSNNA